MGNENKKKRGAKWNQNLSSRIFDSFSVAAGEKNNNELDNERLFSQLRIRNLNNFPRRN